MDWLAAILSLFGFGALLAVDVAPNGSKLIYTAGAAMLGGALAWEMTRGAPLGLPEWLAMPGWVLSALGVVLLVYSMFIEVPWLNASAGRPATPGQRELVSTGSYALCRHPTTWEMVLFLAGLVVAANRTSVAGLAAWWCVLELALIVVQDRLVFPRRIPGYRCYCQATPFLIPTPASVRAAAGSMTGRHDERLSAKDK